TARRHTGAYSARALYDANNAEYILTSSAINLTAVGIEKPTFHYYRYGSSESGYDFLYIEIKNTTETTWTLLRPGLSGSYEYWVREQFELYGYVGNVIQVRFRFKSDASVISGIGWYIDDVGVISYNPGKDFWTYVGPQSKYFDKHSGDYAFWCGNNNTGFFPECVDCSLTSSPIDLTTAKDAKISFWAKFNINNTAGRPPDGLKVLISDDMGATWREINIGFRHGYGYSNQYADGAEGDPIDGKSMSGIETADSPPGSYWVHSDTMQRLIVDISGWAGTVIIIRFRVLINDWWNWENNTTVTFGGIYIDDVQVIGNSSVGGATKSISKEITVVKNNKILDKKPILQKLNRVFHIANLPISGNNNVVFYAAPQSNIEVEKYFIPVRRIYFINAER
ncbi:MAG: hypothetical protein AB1485_07125, partial [Candidatus Thermoplasmatota archaeon]